MNLQTIQQKKKKEFISPSLSKKNVVSILPINTFQDPRLLI